MKEYKVELSAYRQVEATVHVEADSEEEARAKAMQVVETGDVEWMSVDTCDVEVIDVREQK